MDIYLVGGAVRDKRLGLPVRERDWVVVGSTPEEMLQLGYTPVGKDFPVFLHPDTKEEYALARTERKTGHGYTGFETFADAGITLEQDLQRRDLTINAMAETPDGELIDPCHGLEDLDNGLLRHVSPAFAEDPVRILRAARFAARFAHWGFKVAHDTNALMRHMVHAGEVDHLVPERVWTELARALLEKTPARFFDVLYGCGALARLFAEIEPLYLENESAEHGRPEHVLPVLECAVDVTEVAEVRFAALLCDIDNHAGAAFGKDSLDKLCDRLRIPNAYRELGGMALQYRNKVYTAASASAAGLLELLESLDAFRRPERLEHFLTVCRINASVHGQADNSDMLRGALTAATSVSSDTLLQQGITGKALGEALRQARIQAIEASM